MKLFLILFSLTMSGSVLAQTTATPTETPASIPAPTPEPLVAALPAQETMKFFGDFRYRHQSETQEPKQARPLERIQARLGVTAQVEENMKVTMRLMTGSSANSGNQTLGDKDAPGMPRRNFGLDLAYFDYQAVNGLNFYGGKMPQPFTFAGKNQMILDRDIMPEGLAFKYSNAIEKDLELQIQAGSFWIRENYDPSGEEKTDNMLNAGQIGLQWKSEDWTVNLALGAFSYIGLKDTPPGNLTLKGGANGNTLDINGNYPTNFDIDQKLIEIKKKWDAVEVLLFAEFLENTDAETLNKAQAYGLQLAYKSWTFGLAHEQIDKDAVVGLFTDSDFAGGVTSSRGYVASLGYKFTKKITLQYSVYKNQNTIDIAPLNYDRSHLDLLLVIL
ncbi:MAG: putative porin [Pseudobdellovibrionaceae bacterium]